MATSSIKTGCVVLAIILLSWTGFLRDKLCFGVPSYGSALAAQILNLVQKYLANPSTVQRKTFQFLFSNYFSGPKISLSSFLCIQNSKKSKGNWRSTCGGKAAKRQMSLHQRHQVAAANISQHTVRLLHQHMLMYTYI